MQPVLLFQDLTLSLTSTTPVVLRMLDQESSAFVPTILTSYAQIDRYHILPRGVQIFGLVIPATGHVDLTDTELDGPQLDLHHEIHITHR